ncbi:MAG TPA: AAA family ATPase, partial [Xanthobacteraceae bacterium]
PYLTDSVLERIGLPVGPRVKLLAAISELAPRPAAGPQTGRDERAQGGAIERRQAERRQITVMFCELVDSTRLAGSLDPEDFGRVMQSFQRACGAIIERHEGHVSQYRGDAIEAYFGWPAAYEDASERAVRAGLEVIEAVKAIAGSEPLQVRVGINTGMVMVSESGLGDPSKPSGAVGEALHVAARLLALAAPNSVVIAEATSRLISTRFEREDLGLKDLKGVAAPVRAFRVRHVREDTSRFQAAHAAALTPLVGRRTELAFLQERWRDAKDGEGQTICISGMAGIGKSRIVHELEERIKSEPHFTLSLQCLPHCMQSPLFPVIQQIERLAELASEDSDALKLRKLEKLLSLATVQVDNALPLIAEMLSIPIEGQDALPGQSAQQRKTQTLFVLVEFLLGLAAKRPVLCVIEDAQWIDPSTQELLDLAADRIEEARILLLVTHRPEYSGVRGNVSGLSVTRLGRRDLAEMARLALRDQTVSPVVMKRIIEDSDSIPLFVEELARGAIDGAGMDNSRPAASASLVPDSLRDSLVARLDRAPQARNVAEMAAVIGREFSYDMIRSVSSLVDFELDATLAHLEQSEIVHLVDNRASPRYAFKHALVRDAAYELLLKSNRAEIHAKVATVLEKERPETVTGQPELLAYHYARAGLVDPAITYWQRAAERALQRSANVEATHHFGEALALLHTLPVSVERDQQELDLQTRLGATLTTVKGFAAPEVAGAYERARILCRESQDPGQRFSVLRGLWVYDLVCAEWQAASDLAEEMLALAREQRNPGYELEGHRALGMTLLWRGAFVRARDHLEEGRRLYDPAQHHIHAFRFGNDPGIACLVHEAFVLWVLGYPDRALATSRKALALARHLAHPFSLVQALIYSIYIHHCRGEAQIIPELAEEAKALAVEHGFPFWLAEAGIMSGWAISALGKAKGGIDRLRVGISDFLATGARMDKPRWLALLAETCGTNNQPQEGLKAVSEALSVVEQTNECFFQARLCQLRGELLLKEGSSGAAAQAEVCFQEALSIARLQEAKSWELCAATSLARLWCAQFKRREARDLLAPVYGWFTEGFETADLREARTLLDELA